MNWQVHVREKARKFLKKLPNHDAIKIEEVIQEIGYDPLGGDIRKLTGEGNVWRRRVGSYRIFFEILDQQKVVYIYQIKRRTSTTY